jgi:hypothetical protein
MNGKVESSHVLQEFKLNILIVREREVGCSHVVREFEFGFLAVGNPCRNGRRERFSSSEALICQWTSLYLCSAVKKAKILRPHTSVSKRAIVGTFRNGNQTRP